MRAIIPSLSVKAFQYILACLSKIGDDIIVEARPDRFTLSTINITRSAFANFTFTRTFFESYHLDTDGEAIKYDETGPYLRCSVLAKVILSACKIRGNVEQKIEKYCLFMNAAEGVGENCRLTVENIFKYGKSFSCFIKIHNLLYESCPEPLQVLDSIANCPSSWRLPAVALIGLMENFSSKAEEISMLCKDDGITFKTSNNSQDGESGLTSSWYTGNNRKVGTTVVPVGKSSMDSYKLQDKVELTFSMRDFKAIIAFSLALRLPLDGYFVARDRPFLLAVESENIFSANFALATVLDDNDLQERAASEQVSIRMDDVGPENELFLDDDEDWAGALDDLEMEEAAAAAAQQQEQQQQQQQQQQHQTMSGSVDDEAAYEIEEGFLPEPERQ
ncbi:Cell cycle checkpoint control protein rad9b, partial [Modicella reniformis]